MSGNDIAGIITGIVTIYLLWEQNTIFRKQNEIFAAQSGVTNIAPGDVLVRHRFGRYWPMLVMAAMTILTWLGTGYGIYLKRKLEAPLPSAVAMIKIPTWGLVTDQSTKQITRGYVDVSIPEIGPKAGEFKIYVLARVVDNTSDLFTDDRLDRSSAFSITLGTRRIEVQLSDNSIQRLQTSKILDMFVVLLPSEHDARQIFALSALQELHGQLIAQAGVGSPCREF